MEESKTKKFVFNLDENNSHFIENLTYDKKNELINKLIFNHRETVKNNLKNNKFYGTLKKILIFLLCMVIGIPLLIITINFCFDMTVESYSEMEKNFERLFNEQQR